MGCSSSKRSGSVAPADPGVNPNNSAVPGGSHVKSPSVGNLSPPNPATGNSTAHNKNASLDTNVNASVATTASGSTGNANGGIGSIKNGNGQNVIVNGAATSDNKGTSIVVSPRASAARGGSVSEKAADPELAKQFLPHQRYEITTTVLGKGHFAKVKKCRDVLTGKFYAVKIIEKKELVKSSSIVKAEIEILKAVGQHQHIVSLIDQFEDNSKFYLVMELCQGGDLFSQIVEHGKYSEAEAVRCCRQLASALQWIHSKGVTHRDLKADLKVADFGLSKLLKGHQHVMKTVCGTWAYCAPEVITRKPYTETVDNWTLGVLMYILLSGYHPFDVYGEMLEPELLDKIIRVQYDFDDPVWEHVSNQAKELIRSLLQFEPAKRLSIDDYLASEWCTGRHAKDTHNPLVVQRMAKFSNGKQAFRTLVVAKLASNKFKASISKSRMSSSRRQGKDVHVRRGSHDSEIHFHDHNGLGTNREHQVNANGAGTTATTGAGGSESNYEVPAVPMQVRVETPSNVKEKGGLGRRSQTENAEGSTT